MNEFDQVASSYREQVGKAVAVSGFGYEYFVDKKVEHLLGHVRSYFPRTQGLVSLDIGAGGGQYSAGMTSLSFKAIIADQSLQFLKMARDGGSTAMCLATDACRLGVRDASQDVVIMAMVLHHIPPSLWMPAFREARRALKVGGLLAVYEHNPWNPLTRKVMASLPFDRNATPISRPRLSRLLDKTGFKPYRKDYLFFFPSFARALLPLETLLKWCPLGAQYASLAVKT